MSLRALVISSRVTPSIAAWWIFVMIAKLPAGSPATSSRPSMTYISHSGLLRSSGRECSRATWMQNCRQSPGPGQGDVPHVVLEVEVRILDPIRVIEPQRHLHQALPEGP